MRVVAGLGQQSQVMDALHHYRHSGLLVSSALELPEWEAFSCDGGTPDVRIVLSDELCPDCPSDGSVAVGDSLRFAIEGIGGWQIEGGHTIRLHPALTANAAELRLFTLGSAWGGLGYQRGFAMWHGSAVERGGRAVLFCGGSGAGKSTMAAAMIARGAQLVADDLSRIEAQNGSSSIYPSSSRIKLWRGAIDYFGWRDRVLQRDYFRDDKFHCAIASGSTQRKPLQLAAIISLEEGDRIALDPVSGAASVETSLRKTMYRPEMLEALGRWGEQGASAARIVANCPVYRLTRPKDFRTLDETCALVDELWPL